MADENKKPETPNEIAAESHEEQEVSATTGEPVNPTPDYTPDASEGDKLPDETPVEEAVANVVSATEDAADSEPVQAFDSAVQGTMNAIESVADSEPAHAHHAHSDTVVLPFVGEKTMPGGMYTAVFIILGILTAAEVLIAEVFGDGFIRIALLIAIALGKAALVVWFYMHLKDDSRVFLLTLMLPLIVSLLSVLFVLGVPSQGGLGYF